MGLMFRSKGSSVFKLNFLPCFWSVFEYFSIRFAGFLDCLTKQIPKFITEPVYFTRTEEEFYTGLFYTDGRSPMVYLTVFLCNLSQSWMPQSEGGKKTGDANQLHNTVL
uniref:Uncharacterized protein n=1 Tax=Cacopsylla melanoneura TaxID=428564 RepID=A0A8D8V8S7_9HEMI